MDGAWCGVGQVNLPSEMKNLEPTIQLAGTGLPQALPEVRGPCVTTACATICISPQMKLGSVCNQVVVPSDSAGGPASRVRVLMGSFNGVTSPVTPDTRLCVLHVSCTGPGAALRIPAETGDSAILYMRKGKLEIKQSGRSSVVAEPFQTVFFQVRGVSGLVVSTAAALCWAHANRCTCSPPFICSRRGRGIWTCRGWRARRTSCY